MEGGESFLLKNEFAYDILRLYTKFQCHTVPKTGVGGTMLCYLKTKPPQKYTFCKTRKKVVDRVL